MSKIYTKFGDKGYTQLLSGKVVPKYSIRVESYGTLDELSSYIGFLRALDVSETTKQILIFIQKKLFVIMSILACDDSEILNKLDKITQNDIENLEKEIDRMTDEIGPLKEFILPGGEKTVAFIHICRTVTRRAERIIAKLSHTSNLFPEIIIFINRLSDYFFVLSRYEAYLKNFEQLKAK